MLPPYIIEQIRRREEDQRRQYEEVQPTIELPLPTNMPRPSAPKPSDDDGHNVVIIDL